jgi:hypothetical protein
MAVTARFTVVNATATPLLMAIAPFASEDITATTDPQFVQERQRSVSKVVSGSGGIDQGVLTKTYFAFDEIGQPVYDEKYWIDSTQAASTTPVDTKTPIVALSLSSLITGVSWSATANVKYIYHIEWFSPKIAV